MAEVREFWLVNNAGTTYKLSDRKERKFLYNPDGLGFSVEYSTIPMENSDLISSYTYNFDDISGELIFYHSNHRQIYQDYFDFIKFISLEPLYLHYRTPNIAESFYTLVKVISLGKTEIDTDQALHCPIVFKPQTLWQSSKTNVLNVKNEVTNGGKSYPLSRSYYYGVNLMSSISIVNDSMQDCPFSIEVFGECTDFQYLLFDESKKTYGAGKLNGTYDYIYINSNDLEEDLILKSNGTTISNPFNMQDLSVGVDNEVQVTFLKLKPGKSTLKVIPGEDFSGYIKIAWRNFYVSV